jgi:hypothetical protein
MPEIHVEFGELVHTITGPAEPILNMIALLTGECHDVILAKSLGLYANSLSDTTDAHEA